MWAGPWLFLFRRREHPRVLLDHERLAVLAVRHPTHSVYVTGYRWFAETDGRTTGTDLQESLSRTSALDTTSDGVGCERFARLAGCEHGVSRDEEEYKLTPYMGQPNGITLRAPPTLGATTLPLTDRRTEPRSTSPPTTASFARR